MQDDDGQVDVRWIPERITAKTPVNIGIGPTDNWGRYDEKRETDLVWTC